MTLCLVLAARTTARVAARVRRALFVVDAIRLPALKTAMEDAARGLAMFVIALLSLIRVLAVSALAILGHDVAATAFGGSHGPYEGIEDLK